MFSKEKFLYIIILIFCGALSFSIFSSFFDKEDYIDLYNTKIENLEYKIDSLHHLNGKLTSKIDTLNIQVLYLDQELNSKNSKINNLKYEINSQIKAVDSFDDSELEKFFTNRYRQHLDSLKKSSSSSHN